MTPMNISVITPSFDRGPLFERTICSVMDQGYNDLEFILVDALEPAGDGGGCELGVSVAAINKAVGRASGDLVTILPEGDLMLPETLHRVAAVMNRPTAKRWAIGGGIRIGPDDQWLGVMESTGSRCAATCLDRETRYTTNSGMFWQRGLFESFGLFDEQFSRGYVFEFACRLDRAGLAPVTLPFKVAAIRQSWQSPKPVGSLELSMEMMDAMQRHAA